MCMCFLMELKEVVLKSGKVLRADVCVIGAGELISWFTSFYFILLHFTSVYFSFQLLVPTTEHIIIFTSGIFCILSYLLKHDSTVRLMV